MDTELPLDKWMYVMLTWKKDEGLNLYYNADLKADDDNGVEVTAATTAPFKKNFVVGRRVDDMGPPANFQMASLTIFGSYMPQTDVDKSYIFFWSGRKCHLYCTTICCNLVSSRQGALQIIAFSAKESSERPFTHTNEKWFQFHSWNI